MAHSLIDLTKWPTLPAPWSSTDSGETWIWGNYFLTFQKQPKTVFSLTMEMQGKKAPSGPIIYHYAMNVFYRVDRNPHGPSHRPIMTIALEQVDIGELAQLTGAGVSSPTNKSSGQPGMPMMIGLFFGEGRLNLGEYHDGIDPQEVREKFFAVLSQRLNMHDEPQMIGTLMQAHGHPMTGLPAQKKGSGCAPALLLVFGTVGLGIWALSFI